MEYERIPRPGEFYRHFKGKLYQIITVATHTETDEVMVVYQALYGDFKTYVRPLEMFISKVDSTKYPLIQQEYRFELQSYLDKEDEISKDAQTNTIKGNDIVRDGNKISESKLSGDKINEDKLDESKINAVDLKSIKFNGVLSNLESENESSNTMENLEQGINQNLLLFLDAKTYDDKLNVLISLKNKLNERLLDDIAASMDIMLVDGTLEEHYQILKDNLLTLNRFESNRLR